MIVYCCPKCKMVDIGDDQEEKSCMRCSIPMLSLGISSAVWNNLDNAQMKEAINNCISGHEQHNTIKQPEWGEDVAANRDENQANSYAEAHSQFASHDDYTQSISEDIPIKEKSSSEIPPVQERAQNVSGKNAKSVTKKKVVSVNKDDFSTDSKSMGQNVQTPPPSRGGSVNSKGQYYSASSDVMGKYTKMSVAALICSLFGCTSLIGLILGLIDLVQGVTAQDGRKKLASICAIIFSVLMLFVITDKVSDIIKDRNTVAEERITTENENRDLSDTSERPSEIETVDDTENNAETKSVTNEKEEQTLQFDTVGTGTYIVGEDLPGGTYYFRAYKGVGELLLYKTYDDYKADENGFDAHLGFKVRAKNASVGLLNKDIYTSYVFGLRLTDGMCVAIKDAAVLEYSEDPSVFGIKNVLVPGIYIGGDNLDEGKYNLEAVAGSGEILIYNDYDSYLADDHGFDAVENYKVKAPQASVGMLNEDVYSNEVNNFRVEKDQVIVIKDGICLAYGDYSYPAEMQSGAEDENNNQNETKENDEKETEDVEESSADEDNPYAPIYDEYTRKIKEATPGLIEEYKKEVQSNDKGLEGKAEIANSKVEKLAEITNEGVEKMAGIMMTKGSGKYEEYDEWASKLYDVYNEEASKLYDVYLYE